MKLYFFKYGKKQYGLNSKDIVERILFTAFIALLTLVVFSQVSLFGTSAADFTEAKDAYEGAPLGVEEYLYIGGTVELRLMSSAQNPGLCVLINGEEAAFFDRRDITLEVTEGDVIQLDGTNTTECEVAICAISNDLDNSLLGEVFSVNGEIVTVMKATAARNAN